MVFWWNAPTKFTLFVNDNMCLFMFELQHTHTTTNLLQTGSRKHHQLRTHNSHSMKTYRYFIWRRVLRKVAIKKFFLRLNTFIRRNVSYLVIYYDLNRRTCVLVFVVLVVVVIAVCQHWTTNNEQCSIMYSTGNANNRTEIQKTWENENPLWKMCNNLFL